MRFFVTVCFVSTLNHMTKSHTRTIELIELPFFELLLLQKPSIKSHV